MSTTTETSNGDRPTVAADLVEATPGALGHWLLASPLLLFLAWLWVDLFAALAPTPWGWLNYLLGATVFVVLIVLPLGYGAHRLVTSLPGLFHRAGWDLQPLETVQPGQEYLVRYDLRDRHRAKTTWSRIVLRAGQGWVYLEIAAIFVGAILMVPLFFSAVEFGFGR